MRAWEGEAGGVDAVADRVRWEREQIWRQIDIQSAGSTVIYIRMVLVLTWPYLSPDVERQSSLSVHG